jgi:conjugative relaxase-like TrwC/TraI family protein
MLTIAPLAAGDSRYYLALAGSATGYYVQDRALEPAGYWYGDGAQEFGLSGEVTDQHLTRLCEGFDPHTGEKLVRNAGVTEGPKARRHGFDLCWSAPKSVSVAWALASEELREEISKVMHRAVKDGLDYVSEHAGLARVGRDGQQLINVPLTFAIFEHSTSRLGDPNLHCHAVLTPIGKSEPVSIVWWEPPERSSILASPSEAR